MIRLVFLAIAGCLAVGCIRAPDVVIVDRRTALEQQAAGRHPAEAEALDQATLSAGPLPLTAGQLADAGWKPESDRDALASLYLASRTDADRIDELLVRRCLGEALDGTLQETRATCSGQVDPEALSRLAERTNRNRRQIWLFLQSRSRGARMEAVRDAWRREHVKSVACGGQLQAATGSWEVKACE